MCVKTLLVKIAAVVTIVACCHYLWREIHVSNLSRRFTTPTEVNSMSKIYVGDPVTLSIKGIVKFTDVHGLMVIEYKDADGNLQQMVFHVPHTQPKK